jgi:hypothetical protein
MHHFMWLQPTVTHGKCLWHRHLVDLGVDQLVLLHVFVEVLVVPLQQGLLRQAVQKLVSEKCNI